MGEIHDRIREHGVDAVRAEAATAADRLALEAAAAVLGDDAQRLGVTHAGFAMTTLPHKRTEDTVWRRNGGAVRLVVESGLRIEDGEAVPVGLPYGAVARMILLYLQTRAVRTRSREVELGASMNAWLCAMGIPVGGKTYRLVREQATRISACRLTFLQSRDGMEARVNGAFVRESILPAASAPDEAPGARQGALWQERVELDEGFYRSLIEHPLPLREAAIRELSNRSMALDLYVWLAYRLHALKQPTPLTWSAAHGQFGAGYARKRDMKAPFTESLKLATAVYPEARVELDAETGLVLHPSPPPVVETHRWLGRD